MDILIFKEMTHSDYFNAKSTILNNIHPLIEIKDGAFMAQLNQLTPPPLSNTTETFINDAYNYWVGMRYLYRVNLLRNSKEIVDRTTNPIVYEWFITMIELFKRANSNDKQYCSDTDLRNILNNNQLLIDKLPLSAPIIPNTNTKLFFNGPQLGFFSYI
jgi:hypothetical protein